MYNDEGFAKGKNRTKHHNPQPLRGWRIDALTLVALTFKIPTWRFTIHYWLF